MSEGLKLRGTNKEDAPVQSTTVSITLWPFSKIRRSLTKRWVKRTRRKFLQKQKTRQLTPS